MAFNVSQLINNIQGSIDGLSQDLGISETDPNVPANPSDKTVAGVLSTINQGNWLKLNFPYTFSVVDISNGGSPNPFTDFQLPLAPQSINQQEQPAISIKPTQGGTTVNHSGNRYKMLNIEGTTGISPFRGTGGTARKTGEAIFQPKSLKYRSGYEVFLRMRNWLRAYYEYKRVQGARARGLRLIFKNYKDGEFLIVELEDFAMDRQAAKPHLYDYKIQFKVIGHFSFIEQSSNVGFDFENSINNAIDAIDQARGVFLRSQGILRQIESTYNSVIIEPLRKTTLAIKALQGIPLVAADIGNRIIKNTVSEATALAITLGIADQQKQNRTTGALDNRVASIQLPNDIESAVANQGSGIIDSFGEGLMAMDPAVFPDETLTEVQKEQDEAANLPKSFYQDLIVELNRVKSNAEDFFNLGDPTYDNLFNRTATLSADFTKSVTNEEYDLLFAFNQAANGLKLLLSTEELFKSSFDERIQDIVNRFEGRIDLFANTAVQQIEYKKGVTLEKLSQDLLGDSNRWGEIAEVNGLKPPYVVNDKSSTLKNVIKPGEKLLIPIPIQNGFSEVPEGAGNKLTQNLNTLEKSLGVDLKLTDEYDLSLSASGDLELVAGADNMAQGVILKLLYEPGEVMRYPNMGTGILPGRKFPPLEEIKDLLTNSLLQDPRVANVTGLALRRESSSLFLTFNIQIKQVDIPIPVKIKV